MSLLKGPRFINRARHTSFGAGGLVQTPTLLFASHRMSLPKEWSYPAYIDSRPYCLPTDNQGLTSMCAAYSMAGAIEVENWRMHHVAKQQDAARIYAEAKKIDGNNSPGTSFPSVFDAAKNLGILSQGSEYETIRSRAELMFALHKYGVCLLGFVINEGWNYCGADGWISDYDGVLGGHAVLGCFYDKDGVGFQNSWGVTWGSNGYGRMTWDQYDKQIMDGMVIGRL